MPNGSEYDQMETEADRILYNKWVDLKEDTGVIRRRVDWILGVMFAGVLTLLGFLLRG